MKAIAVNGSPRKQCNTAALLESALEGAAAAGAETKLVHLYDLNCKGCTSCFACKLKGGPSYGQCAVTDDIQPLLRAIEQADALILGSPIYYASVSGAMRSFLERLLFQYLVYDATYSSLRKKDIPTAVMYTMNVTQNGAEARSYPVILGAMEDAIKRTLSGRDVPSLYATDTCQFDDYAKYNATAFDAGLKAKRKEEEFPKDCRKAFDIGRLLVAAAREVKA